MLDIVTLLIISTVVVVGMAFILWLAAVPGQIARQRNHPQSDAIAACGWLSLLTCFVVWPVAVVWAYTRPVHVVVQNRENSSDTNIAYGDFRTIR